jgi:branched-chain amino acid transport system substrate-binding protein
MSGLYADIDGPGGLEAIKMAIEDHGGWASRSNWSRPTTRTRPTSPPRRRASGWTSRAGHAARRHQLGTGLAMNKVAQEKKRVYFNIGAARPA